MIVNITISTSRGPETANSYDQCKPKHSSTRRGGHTANNTIPEQNLMILLHDLCQAVSLHRFFVASVVCLSIAVQLDPDTPDLSTPTYRILERASSPKALDIQLQYLQVRSSTRHSFVE